MKRLVLIAALPALAPLLTGCGALSIGEEEFACSGMPGSVYCHSARDVYETSERGIVPSPMRRDARNEDCTDCVYSEDVNPELKGRNAGSGGSGGNGGNGGNAGSASAPEFGSRVRGGNGSGDGNDGWNGYGNDGWSDDEVISNYVSPALPHEPVPVRTPAQVMRIWVAPYVDANGDLIAPGLVYTEIEPRRWIYPETGLKNQKAFLPLQAVEPWNAKVRPEKRPSVNVLRKFNRGELGEGG